MIDKVNISFLMKAVSDRALAFFLDELGIAMHYTSYNLENVQELKLRHLTSLLVLEGCVKLYLAFSFDELLIEHAFDIYADGIEVAEGERDGFVRETAGDIINIVVGNATAQFAARGPAITLSPPIVISEAKSICCHKDGQFYTASLETDFGKMDIYCIAPKEFFDKSMNSLLSEPDRG